MSAISAISSTPGTLRADGSTVLSRADLLGGPAEPNPGRLEGDKTKAAFQEFVSGTFYQQMFKAMRSTQKKAKYFHGGQAEEVFQSQLDQKFSEQLAKSNGGSFSDSLYDAFAAGVRAKIKG